MTIFAVEHYQGNLYKLHLSFPNDGMFMVCDNIRTSHSPYGTMDSGYARVIDSFDQCLIVESQSGWIAMQGRFIRRRHECSCSCHVETKF